MMDAQAQDRAHRIGQKNEVRVFRLVSASPVEERILAQASYKKNRATITIEMSGANAMGKHIENPDKDIVMKSLLHEMNSNTGVSSNVVLPSMNGSGGGGGEDGDDEEEDEEEASDLLSEELLNEMMATSEGELELYRRMDLEQLPSKRPPLMTGEETPAWLMPHHWAKNAQLLDCMRQDSAEAAGTAGPKKLGRKKGGLVDEDDGFFSGGKVMRKRKDLQYDDGLTEKQFMRMMERHANSGGDLNAVGSNTDLPSGKIRFEPVVDDNMPVLRQLQTTDYAFLRKLLNDEITGAVSADGVRDASALFLQKPDKKLYPDYYALIPEPISLKEICAELKRKAYITLADLEFDLCLMALNARTYNTEASFVFLDVQHLRRTFYQRCIEQGLLVGIELSVDSLDEHGALMELPPLPQSYAQLLQEASTGDFISKSSLQALSLVGSSAALKKSTSKTATKASIRPKKSVSETSLSNFADNQSESFSQPIIESTAEPKSSTKSKRKFTFVHTEEDPHSSTEVGQSKTQPSMPQSASKSRKSVSVSDGGASRPTEEPLPRLVLNLSKKNK